MAHVIWTYTAKNDLQGIYLYIAKDSVFYAARLVDQIVQTVRNLKTHPKIGRVVPEYDQHNLREIIYHNYRIVYKITKNGIFIVAIVHASRDLTKIDFG
jgi:addiction module RelE/StbE family toxin